MWTLKHKTETLQANLGGILQDNEVEGHPEAEARVGVPQAHVCDWQ